MQKGIKPSLAKPAEKVTAWPSAIPTSKIRSGISCIITFMEHPVGIAGVTPTILLFISANSNKVFPKTYWYKEGSDFSSHSIIRSPVSLLNNPGACHSVAEFSAGAYPFTLTVLIWRTLGPSKFLISVKVFTNCFTSWPSIWPKYRILRLSKILRVPPESAFLILLENLKRNLRLSSSINPIFLNRW